MNIYEKLSNIQNELKAPKGQYNSFGKYKYRSCEDILEAVKPICKKYKATLVLSDDLFVLGEGISKFTKDEGTEEETITKGQRFYVRATATLYDTEKEGFFLINTAYAREDESKKGMDGSQITGTASSYARKYALNGLFNIDDTKDADTDEYTKQQIQTISTTQEKAIRDVIKNHDISSEKVVDLLKQRNHEKLNELTSAEYMNFYNELTKGVE